MAYIQTNKPAATAGEVSPLLAARQDLEKYRYAFKQLDNYVVYPQGPFTRREPTKKILGAKDNELTILYPFTFALDDSFMLGFNEGYIRFFSGRQYLDTGGVLRDPGHANSPLEVDTNSQAGVTYLEVDLDELWIMQSASVFWIFHEGYPPCTLTRQSASSWTFEKWDYLDGPYLTEESDITINISSHSDTAILRSTNSSEFSGASDGDYVEFFLDGVRRLGRFNGTPAANDAASIIPLPNVIVNLEDIDGLQIHYDSGSGTTTYKAIHASLTVFSYKNQYNYIYNPDNSTWYFIKAYKGVWDNLKRVQASLTDPVEDDDVYKIEDIPTASTDHVEVEVLGTAVSAGGHTAGSIVSTTGDLTLTDREITGTITTESALFVSATDVDRWVRLILGDEAQVGCQITTVNSTTSVDVSFHEPIPREPGQGLNTLANKGQTSAYRLGAWFGGSDPSWPSCATFHEDRVFLSGSGNTLTSQDIWSSIPGKYNLFSPTLPDSQVTDDRAITYTINSRVINKVKWVMSSTTLILGTEGQEWRALESDTRRPFAPDNFRVVPQTSSGSPNNKVVQVGPSLVFVDRSEEKLVQLLFDVSSNSLGDTDLTVMAEHILKEGGGTGAISYQGSPRSQVHVLRDDGTLVLVTYNPRQEVIAFSTATLGGGAEIESVSVAPGVKKDLVYLSVKRTINGSVVRWIEVIDNEFDPSSSTDFSTNYWVDGYTVFEDTYTNHVNNNLGATDYPSTEVAIVVDGVFKSTTTLNASGDVADMTDFIEDPGDSTPIEIVVGFPYDSTAEILPPSIQHPKGSQRGRLMRIIRGFVTVRNAQGFKYGVSSSDLRAASNRTTDESMGAGTPFVSDTVVLEGFSDNHRFNPTFFIVQDEPGPLTVLDLDLGVETS